MKTNLTLLAIGAMILISMPFFITQSLFNDVSSVTHNTFSAVSVEITPPLTPPFESQASHIVISEVQISGSSVNHDFIELYNPTALPVNIEGWRIRKKTSGGTISTLVSIPAGNTIAAYGFFLWSNSQAGYAISIGSDISNTNTLADNNSIELQDNNSVSIDKVGWGSGINQFIEGAIITSGPPGLQSIERKAISSSTQESMSNGVDMFKGNGFDTDDNSTDFILRIQSEPQNSQSLIESL